MILRMSTHLRRPKAFEAYVQAYSYKFSLPLMLHDTVNKGNPCLCCGNLGKHTGKTDTSVLLHLKQITDTIKDVSKFTHITHYMYCKPGKYRHDQLNILSIVSVCLEKYQKV